MILYNIGGNYRYCQNIQRAHKSNHIYFIVDLIKNTLFQKCYDPECRAVEFRSEDVSLPREICPPSNHNLEERLTFDQYLLSDDLLWNLFINPSKQEE